MLDVISPPTTTAICLKRSADAARDLIQRSSFFSFYGPQAQIISFKTVRVLLPLSR